MPCGKLRIHHLQLLRHCVLRVQIPKRADALLAASPQHPVKHAGLLIEPPARRVALERKHFVSFDHALNLGLEPPAFRLELSLAR